jgi:hypothetical protein
VTCRTCNGLGHIAERAPGPDGMRPVACPSCQPWPGSSETMYQRFVRINPGISYSEWVDTLKGKR